MPASISTMRKQKRSLETRIKSLAMKQQKRYTNLMLLLQDNAPKKRTAYLEKLYWKDQKTLHKLHKQRIALNTMMYSVYGK